MNLVTRTRRTAAAVAAVAGALVLSSCSVYDLPLPGGADTGSDPLTVHIKFRDVLDLVPQSTVKIDDVTVGKVTDIALDGYTADVTVELPKNVDLPDNARAEIRQTSLLGEKFVSLSKPASPSGHLGNGDTIGLDDTGRNPEIEEVFGALALVLNGGGVAQLKTISEELNSAFAGREDAVRSIITQTGSFMGQLDANKASIVTALENINRLSLELRRQDGTIKKALDDLPPAIASVNSQRADLVKMLQALSNLSAVGVRVIQASKASTIDSLNNLAPVLAALAKADQNFPKSLQVALTYPFIDEAVGRDPQVARNLHMGDFTNLSANLTLDLFNLPSLPGLPIGTSLADVLDTCSKTPAAAICNTVKGVLSPTALQALCTGLLQSLCNGTKSSGGGGTANPVPSVPPFTKSSTTSPSSKPSTSSGGGSGSGGILGTWLGGVLGNPRAATGFDPATSRDPYLLAGTGYEPGIGTLLMQGVTQR